METELLDQLKLKDSTRVKDILTEFNNKYEHHFIYEEIYKNDQWHSLWRAVFDILNDEDVQLTALRPLCLNTVRILTRNGATARQHYLSADVDVLLELSQLTESKRTEMYDCQQLLNESAKETMTEALKCLCNLAFHNDECRQRCVSRNVVDDILRRFASVELSTTAEFYYMKLLFLLTALETVARTKVQVDLNGLAYMTEWLDEKLHERHIDDEQLDVISEMLKVMFNITTSPELDPNKNEIENLHLTGVLRELLLCFDGMKTDRERTVIYHTINLLTNISSSCLSELIIKCEVEHAAVRKKPLKFEGRNVRVLDILLRHLHKLLKELENTRAPSELILPVMTVLVKCARGDRIMRHYIRSVVLPPLRDVSKRPEKGYELRNYLCRSLTISTLNARYLAAELLFVCCKENVGRMVKYTGYGNAAGLFAHRGLLDGRRVENSEYSSDDEDSDTEEYKKLKHAINPVSGCYEAPKPDPLAGMSDEQKEYEAMKLANLMDQLHRTGVGQPCRIGEDGTPQPVDHILQLQEELPQQQPDKKSKT